MIRTFARPMLASVFVIDGASVLLKPNERAAATAPVVSRIAKTAGATGTQPATPSHDTEGSAVPSQTSGDDMSKNVVRGLAVAKVGAGALFAIGKLPRTSATILALAHAPTMVARFSDTPGGAITSTDTKVVGLATDAALLGALFIASADTHGKPGLGWRIKQARGEVSAAMPTIRGEAHSLKDVLESVAHSMGKDAREVAHVVEDKSHVASQAVADAADRLPDVAKNLREQASDAASRISDQASTASTQLGDVASKAAAKMPDSGEIADRMPTRDQLAAMAQDARDRTQDARDQARDKARDIDTSDLADRAAELREQAVSKGGPLFAGLRDKVTSLMGSADLRSEEARARAAAARAAAAGDIKGAKKNAKAAEKAAKRAAKEAAKA